jgi:hypothetical protein
MNREQRRQFDVMMRIAGVMAGRPIDPEVRPMVEEAARAENRVVIRLRPYSTFYTPPRQVNTEEDIEGLTHEMSASIAW